MKHLNEVFRMPIIVGSDALKSHLSVSIATYHLSFGFLFVDDSPKFFC
jgi:hypothetical protein